MKIYVHGALQKLIARCFGAYIGDCILKESYIKTIRKKKKKNKACIIPQNYQAHTKLNSEEE